VLPVLTRLNGRPEVTPDGHIVYVFPELMTSARKCEGENPPIARERGPHGDGRVLGGIMITR
jgi:hypothetical protein